MRLHLFSPICFNIPFDIYNKGISISSNDLTTEYVEDNDRYRLFLFDIVDDLEEYTNHDQIRSKIIDDVPSGQIGSIIDSIKQLIPSARTAVRKVTGQLKAYFSDLPEDIRIKLTDHGLTGENLKLKLGIVYKIRRELWKSIKDIQNNDLVETIINLSHKLLDAADAVLDSLADVFSSLKAVKEIKELVRSVLRILSPWIHRHQKSIEQTSPKSDNQTKDPKEGQEKVIRKEDET